MDSYQGSTPLNFIPFRLETPSKENTSAPTLPHVSSPVNAEDSTTLIEGHKRGEADTSEPQPEAKHGGSAGSQGSDTDVTVYADSMVQRMEQTQSLATKGSSLPPSASSQSQELTSGTQGLMPTILQERRSSTPIQSEEEGRQDVNLSALESALEVVMTSGSQLPELRDREDPNQSEASGIQSKTDEDNASTVCDVPALPGGDPKVRFAVSRSEEEESTEESSRLVPVELYGYPPFAPETETECEGDTSSEKQPLGPGNTCGTSGGLSQDRLPDLSGRSRAILKEYSEEASPIRLPVGHTTVAFTEPQVYHLLRTLTDETLRRSFSTMERMVLDAVRGSPTALPSRTSHFQLRGRAQTPGPRSQSDSETDSDHPGSATDRPGSSAEDTGGSSFYEETDSATEMDLISKSFKQTPVIPQSREIREETGGAQQQIELGAEGYSSQDTTLHEMREQVQKNLDAGPSKSKRRKAIRDFPGGVFPCEKNFSQK